MKCKFDSLKAILTTDPLNSTDIWEMSVFGGLYDTHMNVTK